MVVLDCYDTVKDRYKDVFSATVLFLLISCDLEHNFSFTQCF